MKSLTPFELEKMINSTTSRFFPSLSVDEAASKLVDDFSCSEEDALIIVTAIAGPLDIVRPQDSLDFEKGFGSLRPEYHIFESFESGYTPSELASVLKQPWWRGNVGSTAFREELEGLPMGSILVRFSEDRSSQKRAIVIGLKLKKVELWKYQQNSLGFIIVEEYPYRLLQDVVSGFALAQGYPLAKETDDTKPIVPTSSGTECIVCMDKTRQVLLMPCKHVDMCVDCAEKLETCPTCRATIESRIEVYMS